MVVKRLAVLPVIFSCYKRATKRSSFYSIRKNTEVQELETNSWNSSLKLTLLFFLNEIVQLTTNQALTNVNKIDF
jgi:hypothetical protein